MIDRIRQDIQQRLEQLVSEADRLRQALTALGSSDAQSTSRTTRRRPGTRRSSGGGTAASRASAVASGTGAARTQTGTRRAASRASATDKPAPARRSRSRASSTDGGAAAAAPTRTRTASGATRSAVLEALAKANGEPMTAGQVASATGLGRPSVSTTLSKLARSGDVAKAARGYTLKPGDGAKA